MLLATLSACASVGGVTLPSVDPPTRSSEAPKLLLGVHRLRAIAAIESWQNNNVSECSALEDLVRNASGLKVGSSLVFPRTHILEVLCQHSKLILSLLEPPTKRVSLLCPKP